MAILIYKHCRSTHFRDCLLTEIITKRNISLNTSYTYISVRAYERAIVLRLGQSESIQVSPYILYIF